MKLRILHVAPSIARSYGGPTQSLAGYAAASTLAGDEVSIAAPECEADDAEALERQSGAQRILLFPGFARGALIVSQRLLVWLYQHARDYDVVHVHGLFNPVSSLSILLARRARVPVVVCPHGTLSRYTDEHRRTAAKRAYFAMIERANVVNASAIHFTTETERVEAAWYGIDFARRGYVIAPPYLPPRLSKRRRDDGNRPATVIFLSRIHAVKNIPGLLHAWKFVLAEEPAAKLLIVGPGNRDLVGALESLAVTLGIQQSVTFRGFVAGAEKDALLAAATLLALPSHHENFGLVVLEAVAAGLPVVISPAVQLAPFVEQNRVGVVAPAEPSRFGRAIVDVLRDAHLREHVASEGSTLVQQAYAPSVIGLALHEMYVSVVTNPPPAAPTPN